MCDSKCKGNVVMNIAGLCLGLLMCVVGVILYVTAVRSLFSVVRLGRNASSLRCATVTDIDDARTFMIGLYLVGFGLFNVVVEVMYLSGRSAQ